MKKEEAEVVMRSIETLRSVRSFKPDSMPKETLDRILRAASMAASGSNTQPWEFVVVQDRDVKARLKEPMLKKWLERIGGGTGMSQRMKETYDEATEMLRNSEKVPALVYCCLDLNRTGRGGRSPLCEHLSGCPESDASCSRLRSGYLSYDSRVDTDARRA